MGSNDTSPFWVENSARLARLWDKGKTARQIGEILGCTRNMVIGRAHRMGLDARPSPIIRGEIKNPFIPEGFQERQERVCEWPEGHPGTPSYSECGKPRHGHAPYCKEHCIKAVRPPAPGKKPVEYGKWRVG